MAEARLHRRSLENPLTAPLLVAVGLVPFVAEVALSGAVPTVPAVLWAAMVVVGTANAALGLPRLAGATLLVALAESIAMLDAGVPGLGLGVVTWTLLALALGALAWSIRSGEGERLRDLVAEVHAVRAE